MNKSRWQIKDEQIAGRNSNILLNQQPNTFNTKGIQTMITCTKVMTINDAIGPQNCRPGERTPIIIWLVHIQNEKQFSFEEKYWLLAYQRQLIHLSL